MKLQRVRAVARKEALHVLRDVRSLIMALALPGLLLVLFGYALSLDVDRVPLLVLDHSRTPQSRELVSRFEGSTYFSVLGRVESYEAITEAIDQSLCICGLVVPPDFQRRITSGRGAEVQILVDGTDSNTASIALGYAEALLADYALGVRLQALRRYGAAPPEGPLDARIRVWYNSRLESKNYIVPGLVAVILMIIAALLTSLTIAREWEMGTMEQLLSTPVRASELVLGKMSAYLVLGLIDSAVAVVLGVFVFAVPLRGSLLILGFSCFVFLFGALAWGILISSIARNQLLAYQLGMLSSFLPAFLLSGFIFAIENMPLPIQLPTYVVPARYMVTILRGVFLKDVGVSVLFWELAFLLAFALLVLILCTRLLKRKIA